MTTTLIQTHKSQSNHYRINFCKSFNVTLYSFCVLASKVSVVHCVPFYRINSDRLNAVQ